MAAANHIHRPMTSLEWGLLLVLSVLWGGSFLFNGVAVKELPTFTIVTARVALAAMILLVSLRAMGARLPRNRGVWGAFFAMGLIGNVIPFSLIVWGQSHIASGVASILNAATPLFTLIVAHFLTSDEKMTGGRMVGAVIGFIGVAIMIGGEAVAMLGVNVLAQLACLAAALSYAFAGVFGRRFEAMGVTPAATATGQAIASSVMLVPLMALIDRPWTLPTPSMAAFLALVGLAALSTALAYILYFRILATAGVANLLLVTFLVPVSAILLGALALGERLQGQQLRRHGADRPWACGHRRPAVACDPQRQILTRRYVARSLRNAIRQPSSPPTTGRIQHLARACAWARQWRMKQAIAW